MALILGTKIGEHDGCFALVRDGEPLFIYEEERFNRIKHGISCAARGLAEGLADAGITLEQIDWVANYADAALVEGRRGRYREFHGDDVATAEARYARVAFEMPRYRQLLQAHGVPDEKIIDVRHHLAHCAGVFYPSPFDDAAILSIDGGGEADTAMLAHGHGETIDVLESNWHPHSLGHFYLAATRWLGWDYGEEGKTMALASFGTPRHSQRILDEVLEVDDQGFFRFRLPLTADQAFEHLFGPRRDGGELGADHKDVAASVQDLTNRIMIALARTLRERTGSRHLLVTGGVGLNSVANGAIMREGLFDQVLAYPQANDTGTALGGALWIEYNRLGRKRRDGHVMRHAYWGRAIDEENVPAVAERYGLVPRRSDSVAAEAARHIADGSIVGWIQGRAEIGPRALGNRSILGDPRNAAIKDDINVKIKHRETWRPFAPSVLAEEAGTYFDTEQMLPFMIVVADVKPEWRERLQAIMHVDGTARVQTVEKEQNPRYHALISAFRDLTGIGMVLNTSYNDRGEPLVQTVDQAVRDFLRTDMDVLVIGDWIFESKDGATRDLAPFHPAWENVKVLDPQRRPLIIAPFGTEGHETFLDACAERGHRGSLLALVDNPACRMIAAEHAAFDGLLLPEQLDADSVARHDALVVLTPWAGHEFVFNAEVAGSDLFSLSRSLHETTGLPLYWVDRLGGVTDMAPILRFDNLARPARAAA